MILAIYQDYIGNYVYQLVNINYTGNLKERVRHLFQTCVGIEYCGYDPALFDQVYDWAWKKNGKGV
jgi:hypothetical protein